MIAGLAASAPPDAQINFQSAEVVGTRDSDRAAGATGATAASGASGTNGAPYSSVTFATKTGTFSNGQPTIDGASYLIPGDYPFNYVLASFTASQAGSYVFGVEMANTDTVMAVYDGSFNPASPGTNVIAFNDDAYGYGGNSEVTMNLAGGQTVAIMGTTYWLQRDISNSTIYSVGSGVLS